MPRPRKCRKVCCLPTILEFTPVGGEGRTPVVLTVDEYEANRLIDKQGFSQEQCGEYMNIARTTAQQIYASARKKLAEALVDGRPLQIRGGDYQLCDGSEAQCACGGCFRRRCSGGGQPSLQGGKKSMKIAIPLDETRQTVCVSLARAPYFLFQDADTGEAVCLENPAAEAQDGAGVRCAQFLVDQDTCALITVRCGENAARVLQAAEVAIYEAESNRPEDNLAAYRARTLPPLTHFHAGFLGRA